MNDLIDRQTMIDLIEDDSSNGVYSCFASYKDAQKFKQKVMDLSPAQPERKRGKWIQQNNKGKPLYGWFFCSECGAFCGGKTNFCSECGADMREVDNERPD